MVKELFLIDLKAFTEDALKDLPFPVKRQKTDTEAPADREPAVYIMRLPDGSSLTKWAPYVLHQVITSRDVFVPPGRTPKATCVVRTVFCVYDEDETRGAMQLLQLMERFRIALLKAPVITKQFELNLSEGLDYLIYPEIGPPPNGTAPYYLGEMTSTWTLPDVQREDGMTICRKD